MYIYLYEILYDSELCTSLSFNKYLKKKPSTTLINCIFLSWSFFRRSSKHFEGLRIIDYLSPQRGFPREKFQNVLCSADFQMRLKRHRPLLSFHFFPPVENGQKVVYTARPLLTIFVNNVLSRGFLRSQRERQSLSLAECGSDLCRFYFLVLPTYIHIYTHKIIWTKHFHFIIAAVRYVWENNVRFLFRSENWLK